MKRIGEDVCNVEKRHDFMLVFDVTDGNPNGDPDAGNMPRVDPETMQGIVTDVAMKRKVRDYVSMVCENDPLRQIYVQQRGILSNQQKKAFDELNITEAESKKESKDAKEWMCKHFYDTRLFGAVMSTKKYNAGQVRGPMQMTFARSIDPIVPQDITITRVALTNAEDVQGGSADDTEARSGQMGRKAFIPYGLYVAYGYFNPHFAAQTYVDSEDLRLFWEALINMWEFDRSASRGRMACRGLYVFTHENKLGNAPSQELFDLIRVQKKEECAVPRFFHNYDVTLTGEVPEGVTLSTLVGELGVMLSV